MSEKTTKTFVSACESWVGQIDLYGTEPAWIVIQAIVGNHILLESDEFEQFADFVANLRAEKAKLGK